MAGGGDGLFHQRGLVLGAQHVLNGLVQLAGVQLGEGFGNALGHAVVKVGNALAAVLIVLVGLNGDGRQRRIAGNAVGLPQEAVAGGEAIVEQTQNVDLGAGGGQRIEIKVVDVYVTLRMGAGLLGGEQVGRVVGLGPGSADLQHAAHGGVAVNVGVVPLHVAQAGVHIGDLVDGAHQAGVGLADAGAVGSVQDVVLGSLLVAGFHQGLFGQILHLLDLGGIVAADLLQLGGDQIGHMGGFGGVVIAGGDHGFENGLGDFALIEQNLTAIALDNAFDHGVPPRVNKK